MIEDPRFHGVLRSALDEVAPSTRLPERIATRVGRVEARRRTLRAGAAVATVIVIMAAAIVAVDRRDDRPVVADASARPFRWERLPDPPVPMRAGASVVWTGSEVVMWGGGSPSSSRRGLRADGAAHNPETGRWRRIAAAPIGPRSNHVAVWTGREMVVWGGTRPESDAAAGWADGAAYDPVADRWRRIPEAPIGARIRFGAAWTGAELVVVGGGDMYGAARPGIGAAYSPAEDRWRLLPELPFTGQTGGWAAWTGEVVLYWRPMVRGVEPGLFAYDPEQDAWTERARPGEHFRLTWDGAVLAWADDRLVVTSGTLAEGEWWAVAEAIAYDPIADRWERLVRTENTDNLAPPLHEGVAWTGHEMIALGVNGYGASAFEPRTGRWYPLPRPPQGLLDAGMTATDDGDVYAVGYEATARLTRDP